MSWSIDVMGSKDGVKRKLEEFKPSDQDSAQFEAMRSFIASEIDAAPDDHGVRLVASGRDQPRIVSVEVTPIQIAQ